MGGRGRRRGQEGFSNVEENVYYVYDEVEEALGIGKDEEGSTGWNYRSAKQNAERCKRIWRRLLEVWKAEHSREELLQQLKLLRNLL